MKIARKGQWKEGKRWLNEDCEERTVEGGQNLTLSQPEALRRVIGVHEVEGSSAPAVAARQSHVTMLVARGCDSKELF
jgi:hypothetical protein